MKKFTQEQNIKLKKSGVEIITLQTTLGTIDAVSMPRRLSEKIFGKKIFRK